MSLFYLLMLTIVVLLVYVGYDETLRLIRFLDLSFKYTMIRIQMKWMERKLRRKLLIDSDQFKKSLQEYKKYGD